MPGKTNLSIFQKLFICYDEGEIPHDPSKDRTESLKLSNKTESVSVSPSGSPRLGKDSDGVDVMYKDVENFTMDSPLVTHSQAFEVLRNMKLSSLHEFDFENGLLMIQKFAESTKFVKSHFPQAQPSSYVLNTVKKELQKRNIVPSNTLFAQSVCPDEINHCNSGIAGVFEEYFSGESFHLGGLGGIPFTGY